MLYSKTMKVFIIYGSDGYGGVQVDKIFSSRRSALDYVIASVFSHNLFYSGRSQEFLDSAAAGLVSEHEVEP